MFFEYAEKQNEQRELKFELEALDSL